MVLIWIRYAKKYQRERIREEHPSSGARRNIAVKKQSLNVIIQRNWFSFIQQRDLFTDLAYYRDHGYYNYKITTMYDSLLDYFITEGRYFLALRISLERLTDWRERERESRGYTRSKRLIFIYRFVIIPRIT